MTQSIILGIGTGRCGTSSLAKILNQQTDAVCSFDEPPLLPWREGTEKWMVGSGQWGATDDERPSHTLPSRDAAEANTPSTAEGEQPSPPAPLPSDGRGEIDSGTIRAVPAA